MYRIIQGILKILLFVVNKPFFIQELDHVLLLHQLLIIGHLTIDLLLENYFVPFNSLSFISVREDLLKCGPLLESVSSKLTFFHSI